MLRVYDFEDLDHYALLGLTRQATPEEIKRAYRREIARYHPDRFVNAPPAEQEYASRRSQRLTEAYATLSDFAARTAYNLGQAQPRRTAQPRPAPRPAEPRDHQAELYAQAREHLDAGRIMQAAAALRQLQRLNPFYRDSADLLADVEQRLQRPTPTGRPAAVPRRMLFAGGVIGAALLAALAVWGAGARTPAQGAAEAPTLAPAPAIAPAASIPAPTLAPTLAPATSLPAPTLAPTLAPATSLPTPTLAPPTAVPTPSPEQVLATPAVVGGLLDGGTLADGGWANAAGNGWRVGYQGNDYQIFVDPGIGTIWSFRTMATPEATIVADVQVNSGASAGLLLRFVDADNYLSFSVAPEDGSYLLAQRRGGALSVLASGRSDAVRATAANRLQARVESARIAIAINDVLLAEVAVADLPDSPRFGMLAISANAAADARFANLEIRAIPPASQP